MKKQTILMCALGVAAIAATAIGTGYSVSSKKDGVFFAGGDDGVWKHYARKEATATDKGIREYWVNCLTNEHVFTAPNTGTIEEGGAYKTEGFAADDDRWIYPATLAAQDVVMTETTKALDLGTYAGGTVSYIKAGTFNLGTDPANLDVSGFKADHTDDGLKTVEIGTIKDGKEYALTCETTFVTAMIKTVEDYSLYILPDAAGTNKYGYFKLANNLGLTNKIDETFFDWKASFSGVFDGCGYAIDYKSGGDKGAFKNLDGATIKNLTINDYYYSNFGTTCLLAKNVNAVRLENVKTVIKTGRDNLKGDVEATTEDNKGYLAASRFMGVTVKDCIFDATGYSLASLFGRGGNFTEPTVVNSTVKASRLAEAMHSNYTGLTYQPANVEITDPKTEKNISGLTFVKA